VRIGDTVRVEVSEHLDPERRRVTFDCVVTNQEGTPVVTGEAEVLAPSQKVSRPRVATPKVYLRKPGDLMFQIVKQARALEREPLRCAVVHPVDDAALGGAFLAARAGLIEPVLVGPEARIRQAAEQAEVDISAFELVATPHSHAAAEAAVALARDGRVESLMKGSLHTDELMRAVVDRTAGLRTDRRMSHVFVIDVPSYHKPLLISDAAINVSPDLEAKADIIRNAIGLAHALGTESPKVALLSAVETVNPDIESTLHAAALCKMAQRGQIVGGILDGPLAFDNAVSAGIGHGQGHPHRAVAGRHRTCWSAPNAGGGQHAGYKELVHSWPAPSGGGSGAGRAGCR
jgi:phosphotransacetylase